jgi:hypothetical protein
MLVRSGRFCRIESDHIAEYSIPGDMTEYRGRGQTTVFYVESVTDESKLRVGNGVLEHGGGSVGWEDRGHQTGSEGLVWFRSIISQNTERTPLHWRLI